MVSEWSTALLLVGWMGVALGIGTHDGRYSLPSLVLITAGTMLVGAGVFVAGGAARTSARVLGPFTRAPGWAAGRAGPASRVALAAAALTVGLAPLIWHPRYFAHGAGWTASQVLAAAAGVLAAASVLPAWGRLAPLAERSWPFWTALGLMSAAGVTMIASAPAPFIDVFWLLQGSTKGLLSGADMYRQQWGADRASYIAHNSHGLFDVYPYLPWTSVLLLPFRALLGDIRYGMVVALGVAAVIARRLTGSAQLQPAAGAGLVRFVPALLPLLMALYPKVTYGVGLAWTEPLLIALLAGMVLAAERGRMGFAVACLALALASKQHIVILLPLVAMWPRFGWRRALTAAGAALLLISPWIIAGPRDFWHDAVHANLGLGYRSDALCLATFIHKAFGFDPGFALTAIGLVAGYLLAWRVRGNAFGFCAGAGVIVVFFDFTNTQSFFNHYTLGMAFLVLAICLRARSGPLAEPGSGGVPARDQRLVENLTSSDDSSR